MKKHRLPANLKYLRAQICVTQKTFAELVSKQYHMAEKTYSHFETAFNEPNIDAVRAIAQLYGITMDELCYGEKPITNFRVKLTDKEKHRFSNVRRRMGII